MSATRLGDALRSGEARLSEGPHPERARQDAERLLLVALGKNKAWLMAHADESLADNKAEAYAELLTRRLTGEPIQYITGEAEFYGLPFRMNRHVLIPRPETEHSVEKALHLAANFTAPRIVDVGTGSGAIAVAVAHQLRESIVTAIDLSSAALEVAKHNAARNGVADRIRFLEGDLLAPVAHAQFDIVISNPPYVPDTDRETLSVEVCDYEPAQALFAGEDGLAIYRRLIPQAFSVLIAGGYVVLEIGYAQETAIRALLADAGFATTDCTADLQGIPRVLSAMRP